MSPRKAYASNTTFTDAYFFKEYFDKLNSALSNVYIMEFG
jgi:hypothetical protein